MALQHCGGSGWSELGTLNLRQLQAELRRLGNLNPGLLTLLFGSPSNSSSATASKQRGDYP
jgi:hypothetical protein